MHRNKWKWKHYNQKPMRFSKSSAKRKVHSNTSLPQETRKHQINNLTLIKQLEKEEMKNPKVSRRKEIIKIWAEISGEKKQRRLLKKSTKLKAGSSRR